MKVHILFHKTTSPAGGGNQFLRALDKGFREKGVKAQSLREASVVLFNSHHHMHLVAAARRKFPNKVFIHRIDGPMRLYNSWADKRDYIVKMAASMISDGTIFQSRWSRDENYRLGLHKNRFDTVIHNAADPEIFNRKGKREFSLERKTRIITASWSPNPRKGFDAYEWLDNHLDFSRFEMTFVGNSPIKFRKIKHLPPMTSEGLARVLKEHDIYIFASRIEACSNSLIEALSCGVPVVASNSSSNPEVVGGGGELFKSPEEIPAILERIVSDYSGYRDRIVLPSIEDTVVSYLDFMRTVNDSTFSGSYRPKRLSTARLFVFAAKMLGWKLYGKLSPL